MGDQSICTGCYTRMIGGPRCKAHDPPRIVSRLVGWRVLFEQSWRGERTLTRSELHDRDFAHELARSMRAADASNVRVVKVYRTRHRKPNPHVGQTLDGFLAKLGELDDVSRMTVESIARDAALEEAARECDAHAEMLVDRGRVEAARECAEIIRSRKKGL